MSFDFQKLKNFKLLWAWVFYIKIYVLYIPKFMKLNKLLCFLVCDAIYEKNGFWNSLMSTGGSGSAGSDGSGGPEVGDIAIKLPPFWHLGFVHC